MRTVWLGSAVKSTWFDLAKLGSDQKGDIDLEKAVALMCDNPSMIKRPVLIFDGHIEVGFSAQRYAELFS
nr:ArsC/Spx/MgsR family protein [Mariprofundus micogutta]